ncbi:MAG: UDP-2,3-diacylglucosamine diphosphatase [Lysobacterales bacterium]|jgi:UDP-2,3-diacylglucosamine pyrophosphatase LpxH
MTGHVQGERKDDGYITKIRHNQDVSSIFISDVHLGFAGCSAEYVLDFLENVKCRNLYLVGDIIDFWSLRRKRYWPETHTKVLKKILEMAQSGTRVVMVPGNHDETLRKYNGLNIGAIEVNDFLVHETPDGRRLLVLHGDQFDSAVRCSPLLAMIGASLYDVLLQLNVLINAVRRKMGKEYWSLATYLKNKVKNAVRYIERFEAAVARAARREGVDGVICGHIHRAEIRRMENITYMNCGDWVESCTALVEHHDGRIELLQWREDATCLKERYIPSGRTYSAPDLAA